MTIEEYFTTTFIDEKAEIDEINKIINDVLPTFSYSISGDKGWVYEISAKDQPSINEYSASTCSMILFALGRVMNVIIDLDGKVNTNEKLSGIADKNLDQIKEKFNTQVSLLAKEFKDKFTSGTFGKNDIFTLGWSFGVLNSYSQFLQKEKNTKHDEFIKLLESKKDAVKNLAENKLIQFMEHPDDFGKLFEYEDGEGKKPLDHAFPALRAVQIYCLLMPESPSLSKIKIQIVKDFLMKKIHSQLSYHEIANSNFDASELVFALEGILLIDQKMGIYSINLDFINRIFDVVRRTQLKSPYWRPLKPFITTEQGMGLLPLSVEIANSLIRICSLLERQGVYYIDQQIDLFRNYYKWLKSRLVVFTAVDHKRYSGWHSEHVNKPDIIHPWETAQVTHFLITYAGAMQKRISRESLKLSKLEVKNLKQDDDYDSGGYWQFAENKYEPLKDEFLKGLQVYYEIGPNYIESRLSKTKSDYFSMLFYGPPGTGKTTIAEQISIALGWPLIVITPSDFLISGGDTVELRAKMIFNTLLEQKDVVILFDEIDRLILDRDSRFYQKQSDVFQFMTPSMLVKIRELRKKENVIFIVNTNYEDRIDPAIKRVGRIDNKYLVLTKDRSARIETIANLMKGYFTDGLDKSIIEDQLKTVIFRTCYMTHDELVKAIKPSIKSLPAGLSVQEVCKHLESIEFARPLINLDSYRNRFHFNPADKFDSNQEPFDEFLMLVFLGIECRDDWSLFFSENNNMLTCFFKLFCKEPKENYFGENFILELKRKSNISPKILGSIDEFYKQIYLEGILSDGREK